MKRALVCAGIVGIAAVAAVALAAKRRRSRRLDTHEGEAICIGGGADVLPVDFRRLPNAA